MFANIFLWGPFQVFCIIIRLVVVQVNNKSISRGIFFIEKFSNFPVKINSAVIIVNMQVQGFKGSNIKDINLSNLSSGNYMLKLQTAGEVSTMPLVKAN